MIELGEESELGVQASVSAQSDQFYGRRSLSYADSVNGWFASFVIRIIEWATGKSTIRKMVHQFEESSQDHSGQKFWRGVLNVMNIQLTTPMKQIQNIPAEGPVVLVANHPHGLVDGIVLAELIGKVRTDYKILARGLLTHLDETASSFLIPVPFPDEQDAQSKMIEMRKAAMGHLADGGAIALFPAGVVMSSDSLFGPALEREWGLFTAKLIRKSNAQVVPVFFPGSNSRAYCIANRISTVLRQGLLLHEVVRSCHQAQSPIIGKALKPKKVAEFDSDPRGFMNWLRSHTISLGI